MGTRRRYRRKADQFIVAVQLDLDTDGFTYDKWGGQQRCKRGDWLVDREGDIYTVDSEVFSKIYRNAGPGIYVKTTPLWAEIADKPGSVITLEGEAHYKAGDYLVYSNEDGTDAYCISGAKFESMYELDD